MSLRLIVVRHAKSGWDDPTLDDHDRPLSARGIRASGAIGRWLKGNHHIPDLVLSSSSQRTRETWSLIQRELGADPRTVFRSDLYLSSPDLMLETLRRIDDAETVLLLAHNPGTALLAAGLVMAEPKRLEFGRYPTAATTIIEFPIDQWSDLDWRKGNVVDFVVPRDLEKPDQRSN